MAALPQAVEAQILPSPNLSILELLQYDLPIEHPTFLPGQNTDFFDKNTPNVTDLNIIRRIPTPSEKVILSLQKHLANTIESSDSDMSIKCIHSVAAAGMTYPLWIITYWAKVSSVREIRDGWRKGEVYLRDCLQRWRKNKNTEGVDVVNQIFDVLAIITILLICYCDCHSILSQCIKEEVCEKMTNNWSALVTAIRSGLKGLGDGLNPQGLFKFWKRGTKEDRNQYFGREDERHKEFMEQHKETSDRKKQVQNDRQRECARLRKQKSRARKRESKNIEKKKRVCNDSGLVKCT
jgi:hypothetical protein